VSVVLNEQTLAPAPGLWDIRVTAVDITFTNAPFNPFGGNLNGRIEINEAFAGLRVAPNPPVGTPEPASASLLGIGCACLTCCARRRTKPPAG
jgi:hypothetical protein